MNNIYQYFNYTKYFLLTRFLCLLRPKLGLLKHYLPREITYPEDYKLTQPINLLPKISIVTPSFKQAKFLIKTMDSVMSQGYPNLEYFIKDGGSDDGSIEIIRLFEGHLHGWESTVDTGQAQAINLGFRRTSGDIMAWINSDDLLMPGTLARVAEYFMTHPDVDVVYGHRILIDDEDREVGRWILPPHDNRILSWTDFVPQETLFWRRRVWDAIGGQLDENFQFAMDWDLLLRFRERGANIVRLPFFMGAFRVYDAQKTSSKINDIGKKEMAFLRYRSLGREVSSQEIHEAIMPYLFNHIFYHALWHIKIFLIGFKRTNPVFNKHIN